MKDSWIDLAVSEDMPSLQTMFQDCRKIFVVPSFVIILVAEIIMVIGGSGAGYQIMYFEVGCLGMVPHIWNGSHAGTLFSQDVECHTCLHQRELMLHCTEEIRTAPYFSSRLAVLVCAQIAQHAHAARFQACVLRCQARHNKLSLWVVFSIVMLWSS